MNVGDYVKYKKLIYHNQGVDDIRISKIKDIEDAIETGYNQKFIFFENGNGEYEDRIIKSSPNIIDLIEEGDILKLLDVQYDKEYKAEVILDYNDNLCVIDFENNKIIDLKESLLEKDIKLLSIVTKEQFEAMQYKVGE